MEPTKSELENEYEWEKIEGINWEHKMTYFEDLDKGMVSVKYHLNSAICTAQSIEITKEELLTLLDFMWDNPKLN